MLGPACPFVGQRGLTPMGAPRFDLGTLFTLSHLPTGSWLRGTESVYSRPDRRVVRRTPCNDSVQSVNASSEHQGTSVDLVSMRSTISSSHNASSFNPSMEAETV